MRVVIESLEVMAEVDDAQSVWARFHDAWSVVHWVLARDPTIGKPLHEGGHLRAMVFDGSYVHQMPTIYVLYEITTTEIIIQRVRITDALVNSGKA